MTAAVLLLCLPQIFTSTSQVDQLFRTTDGTIWAQTRGGFLSVSAQGIVSKRNTASGPVSQSGAREVLWKGQKVKLTDPWIEPSGATSLLPAKDLWVGTMQNGLWRYDGRAWSRITADAEPHDHNVQGLAWINGNLLAMTLDQGIASYDGRAWQRVDLADPRPREVVTFNGQTYAKCADGSLSVWQGREILDGVYALTANDNTLFAGQWGGWASFDGRTWVKHRPPDLAGVIVTTLAIHANQLYIGTQGSGLGVYDRKCNEFRWIDRGLKIGDDWITALHHDGARLWIGTFVGGLSVFENGHLCHFEKTNGKQITAITSEAGATWIGTRFGLLRHQDGALEQSAIAPKAEVQALLVQGKTLWVGKRVGLVKARIP